MNETIVKFGYPATLVADYQHWVVLLRPAQPTLGALVLAAKSDATAFPELPQEAFAELWDVTADIEATLQQVVTFERINYLMLMMVDPHVHYHVIPRYSGARKVDNIEIADAGWPKMPALNEARTLNAAEITALAGRLKAVWPSTAG
jgi:diadenosine tetraphosphate (Ap4A) HIT family hydrolase